MFGSEFSIKYCRRLISGSHSRLQELILWHERINQVKKSPTFSKEASFTQKTGKQFNTSLQTLKSKEAFKNQQIRKNTKKRTREERREEEKTKEKREEKREEKENTREHKRTQENTREHNTKDKIRGKTTQHKR